LGKNLKLCNRKLKCLDVCCGKREFYNSLNLSTSDIEYTSIDIDTSITSHGSNSHGNKHITGDIFTLNFDEFLQKDYFDIIIIDHEPHGREIKVYNKFLNYLANTHLIICNHITFIDLLGPYIANNFLDNLSNQNKLVDYFGISDSNLQMSRDLYVIASYCRI